MVEEKVKIEITIPSNLYNALEYYVRHTIFWAGNNTKDQAIAEMAAQAVTGFLEGEAASGFPMAVDSLRNELQNHYEVI